MRYFVKEKLHPGLGFLPSHDCDDWTCCICGYQIEDCWYTKINEEVFHDSCLDKLEDNDE